MQTFEDTERLVVILLMCILTPIPLTLQMRKLIQIQSTVGLSFVSFVASFLGCMFAFINLVILNWDLIAIRAAYFFLCLHVNYLT